MKITEVGLLVTLVYASDNRLSQVINYLARPENKGGLGLVKAESEVWHQIEKNISVWQPSDLPVKQVQILYVSFAFREGGRYDWSMALNELERAMTGLTTLPFGRTCLYLGTVSDKGKFSEVPLQGIQIHDINGKPFTSILSRTENADRRLYLLSSASEGQDMVYLALEKEKQWQKVSQMPLFAPYAALSRADTIVLQFYRQANAYLSDESRQTLHLATNALMTNAIEMLQQAKSCDYATLSLLNAQVATAAKMTADLRWTDHQLERLQTTYDSHLQGNQELASLFAYHRQQMNNLYIEIGAELKEANLALQTGYDALSTLHLNYECLQTEERGRLNQLEKAHAIDAEQAIREQTEAIRQQPMLLQELIERDRERIGEARLAAKQAELEKKRLEEELRAVKKQAQLKEQEIRVTQEQVQREEEQAAEEFEVIKKQTLLIQQQLVALKQQTLALKQQTLATEQQTRLIQELLVQELRSSKRIQSILIVIGIALVVDQIVGREPTFIFWRALVIIGTALLITLLVYMLARLTGRGGEQEAPSQPKEVEEESHSESESSNAPLRLPPSDENDFL